MGLILEDRVVNDGRTVCEKLKRTVVNRMRVLGPALGL